MDTTQIDSRELAKILNIKDHAHWLVRTVQKHLKKKPSEIQWSFAKQKFCGRPKKFAVLTAQQVRVFLINRFRSQAQKVNELIEMGFAPLIEKINKVVLVAKPRERKRTELLVAPPPPTIPVEFFEEIAEENFDISDGDCSDDDCSEENKQALQKRINLLFDEQILMLSTASRSETPPHEALRCNARVTQIEHIITPLIEEYSRKYENSK